MIVLAQNHCDSLAQLPPPLTLRLATAVLEYSEVGTVVPALLRSASFTQQHPLEGPPSGGSMVYVSFTYTCHFGCLQVLTTRNGAAVAIHARSSWHTFTGHSFLSSSPATENGSLVPSSRAMNLASVVPPSEATAQTNTVSSRADRAQWKSPIRSPRV